MSELPIIAGWPADYPKINPKEKIILFLTDLLELQKNKKLSSSHLWLSKFARNCIDLEKELLGFQESHDFNMHMKELLNWIESSTEQNITFSEIIFNTKVSHYKNVKQLEKFVKDLIKDDSGFKGLISTAKKALKK